MKLTLLGTSHGVPSDIRYGSCYMLEVGNRIYIFDGGAPVVDLLLRRHKHLTKVKAFFNSHFHGDHIDGALSMLSLFEWYFKDVNIDAFFPEENSKKAVINYMIATGCPLSPERIRLNTYDEGVIFDDGSVRVTAIPVNHYCGEGKKSNAFLIEAEGKSILYTGDMSESLEDFPVVAFDRFINLIISESAHCSSENLMQCMDKIDTDIFVISHVYPLEKIEDYIKVSDRYKFNVHIACDDDEFVI